MTDVKLKQFGTSHNLCLIYTLLSSPTVLFWMLPMGERCCWQVYYLYMPWKTTTLKYCMLCMFVLIGGWQKGKRGSRVGRGRRGQLRLLSDKTCWVLILVLLRYLTLCTPCNLFLSSAWYNFCWIWYIIFSTVYLKTLFHNPFLLSHPLQNPNQATPPPHRPLTTPAGLGGGWKWSNKTSWCINQKRV